MLVLPNAWDAASAKVLEAAGFAAIATTSGGVANALGYEDHQGAPIEEMLAAASRITRSVSIPVTVDFEAGYGMEPRQVVDRLIGIGAAGFNFEDSDHIAGSGLVDADVQAERIRALKEAGRTAGVDLLLNARVDVFIQRQGTIEVQVAEGLRRARLYKDAGADCIYPILQGEEGILAQFIQAAGAINVNLRPGGTLTLQRAAAIGVRRVSYATSLFRESMATVERLAAQIREESTAL